MDLNQYLDIFIEESKEHLQIINDQLLVLERNPNETSIINEIFRSAHTLKGMSATMGYEDLANLTHQMENVLDGIRNDKISVTTEILDILLQSVEYLEEIVFSIADGGDGKKDVTSIVNLLNKVEAGELDLLQSYSESSEVPIESSIDYDQYEVTVLEQSEEQGYTPCELRVKLRKDCLLKSVRVYMVFETIEKMAEVIKATPSVEILEEEKFDETFTVTILTKEEIEFVKESILKVSEVEEVQIVKLDVTKLKSDEQATEAEQVQNLNEVKKEVAATKQVVENEVIQPKTNQPSNKTIRVNIDRLDVLMNLFEELVIDRGRLEQISNELNHNELHETVEKMSRISNDLQNIILNMRMVPIDTVFNRFPRMVRQLAKDLGKHVELQIIGADTELDRTVIDEIGDPLVHLIRNAIDHGIETPGVRTEQGKIEEGIITLKAYHSGNHVFIEIADNGAGISKDRVLNKAIERGVISKDESLSLSDKEVYELILSSGFSTAETISDISGRGVGLDVVKNTIESLGGSISIDSIEGSGTTFSIQLPLTLSIISVLLTEIGNEKYAIPLSSIIETAIIKREDILSLHGQQVINFRDKIVPLVFLERLFEIPKESMSENLCSLVLVKKGEKLAGLVVDSFIGQQEVVLKSLGNYLSSTFAISGATILGDGQVALIVDCNALIK
ncbi:chemotaxis protein CheA [Bacillus alkalisoli]|uniref:chemotaxis protein CheA n=1 Tax=Bacillus alkalisoli TaxID=2011008 RepID=UPI000C241600|nr:chemotaxis protein CheA [Bacillus alkalisoli]